MTRILALVVFVTCLPASAAIVYEPVQYQYSHHNSSSGDHSQRGRYYYGGSDVLVHRHAQRPVDRRTYRDAEGMISNVPARVYSDSIPRLNAALYGWTANDAKNQAYASVPRYFRKADLMYSSHRDHAGNLIVPATPPSSDRGSLSLIHI
mgnify:CR=1 FL=1